MYNKYNLFLLCKHNKVLKINLSKCKSLQIINFQQDISLKQSLKNKYYG